MDVSHNHDHHARRFRVHPDMIDRLDDVFVLQYHLEGPYDAACAERNKSMSQYSPVAALSDSDAEILKATPPYKIDDCLHCHRPLDGVAFYHVLLGPQSARAVCNSETTWGLYYYKYNARSTIYNIAI